jgi:hypothetical protein
LKYFVDILSTIAKDARVLFTVPEDEYTFSQSLAAPMYLIQCIAVATAALRQLGRDTATWIPIVTKMGDSANEPKLRAPWSLRRRARSLQMHFAPIAGIVIVGTKAIMPHTNRSTTSGNG